MARVAALVDSGFGATPLTDPLIIGDISGNGRLNAADASLVARSAALIEVAQIPSIPTGVLTTGRRAGILPAEPIDAAGRTEEESTTSSTGFPATDGLFPGPVDEAIIQLNRSVGIAQPSTSVEEAIHELAVSADLAENPLNV